MLRSVRELENARVTLADGTPCGRIKDFYFDDHTWKIRFLKVSLDPVRFGHKQVLLTPGQVFSWNGICELGISHEELQDCPLDSSYLPVCLQYASIASGSPLSRRSKLLNSDPHLRSAKALRNYNIHAGNDFAGWVTDFILDTSAWQVSYLQIEQLEQRKRISFHIHPKNIEKISWSTQRMIVHALEPVTAANNWIPELSFDSAAA